MNIFNDPNRIPENYGLRIAGGLILYFIIMKVVGLGHHVSGSGLVAGALLRHRQGTGGRRVDRD